jgi:hypothetical protein
LDDGCDIVWGNSVIGDEGVLVQDFAGEFMGDDQFAPLDAQSIVAIMQGDLVDEAIVSDFPVLAVQATLEKGLDSAVPFQKGNGLE